MQEEYEIIVYKNNIDDIFKEGDFWTDIDGYKNIFLNVNVEQINDDHYKITYKIMRDKVVVYGTERHISEDDK